jgi:hypothetical protein
MDQDMRTYIEFLYSRIKTLNEKVWEGRATRTEVDEWLLNFEADPPEDRMNALYLLSNFVYFGSQLIKEMLRSLYRDLYRYPIVEKIRRGNDHTHNLDLINRLYDEELQKTYFLGVGNPSESGSHLLYYFRQENKLPKTRFIHTHRIFSRPTPGAALALRDMDATQYVFIDDFCGSGDQGVSYSQEIVEDIKSIKPDASVAYYVLFGTEQGLDVVRNRTRFDSVECIYELDETFKCFHPSSRFFETSVPFVKRETCEEVARSYGERLWPGNSMGHGECQLLIGFSHNTPDNTLPIIWYDEPETHPWTPIFRRYPKYYW